MQEVIKDDSKQHFNTLLSHLEELMGKEKFSFWLAEKYPHFDSFEARKRRVWMDELLYKKEIEFELNALQQWKLLQDCEAEKVRLQEIAREYYLFNILYFLELEYFQADCLRRMQLLYKLMLEKLEELERHLIAHLKKLEEKMLFIDLMITRLYNVLNRLERSIRQKTEALLKNYFKLINLLANSDNSAINKIHHHLLSDLRKVKIGYKSITDFHSTLYIQIAEVKQYQYVTPLPSLDEQYTQVNDEMHALIEDTENREEYITSLEIAKDQKAQCQEEIKQKTHDLTIIEKSHLDINYLDVNKPGNSYAEMAVLFKKAETRELDHLLYSGPVDQTSLEEFKQTLSEFIVLEDDEEEMECDLGMDEMDLANQLDQVDRGCVLESS